MSEHADCHAYCAMISEFIDGELSKDLCTKLEEHLSHCNNCTIVFNTMKKTIELYHDEDETPELPEGVKKRLFTSLSLADYLRK